MNTEDARIAYVDLLKRTSNSIDSLIHELEDQTLHSPDFRKASLDMSMDSIPTIRFLKESKKQIDISLSVYDV